MEDTPGFDEKFLKSIKVAIKRGDFQKNRSSKESPLKRDLGDPKSLKIHFCGTNRVPVFTRADVKVNIVKLEADSLDRHDRHGPKSSALFKEYYNSAPPSYPECSSDNAYPSTSREFGSTNSRHYRDRSTSSERSNSSRSRRESHRSKSYERKSHKREGDGRSKSPKYYRRSSSRSRECRRSRSPRYKYYKEYTSSRRKSQSPKRRRSPEDYNKYKKRYPSSPERRRSRTPLRPGEYRPPKHQERSPPPTYRRKSPSLRPAEYRPKRHHSRSPDRSRSSAVGYPRPVPHGHYEAFGPPPPHLIPRYMPDMFRSNGPFLMPHIQYIPVPQPIMPPMPRHHTIQRPPKIYNNRPIPILNPPVRNEAPAEKKTEEKKDDSSK